MFNQKNISFVGIFCQMLFPSRNIPRKPFYLKGLFSFISLLRTGFAALFLSGWGKIAPDDSDRNEHRHLRRSQILTEHRLPSGTDPPMPLLPEPYRIAFEDTDSPFIFYYGDPGRAGISPRKISRGDFLLLTLKATGIFSRLKMQKGERFLNGFGVNSPEDLVFRLAATLSGTTPVTLNWQTDTPERAAYKASVSSARLMLTDGNLDPSLVDAIREVQIGRAHV